LAHGDAGVAGAAEGRVDEEQQQDRRVAAQHPGGVGPAHLDHRRGRAHQLQQLPRPDEAGQGERRRGQDAYDDGLHCRSRSQVGVLLADAPGHEGGGGHGQTHGQAEDDGQQRLRQPYCRHRVGSKPAHPEHVQDAEDRLHQHLEDHRHGKQEDGSVQRAFGVVVVAALHGLLEQRPPRGPVEVLGVGGGGSRFGGIGFGRLVRWRSRSHHGSREISIGAPG
jgi:hypothetical protein